MTVKEIFELRKQGKTEEAYEAIRPMYAVHKGKYTTLCMFWTASDILKKRAREQQLDEAERIFRALLRILPNVEDKDGRAHTTIYHHALMLDREMPSFCILDFIARLDMARLSPADWTPTALPAVAGSPSRTLPSVVQQLLARGFLELEQSPTVDDALRLIPLLQESFRRDPGNKKNEHYRAFIHRIVDEHKDDR